MREINKDLGLISRLLEAPPKWDWLYFENDECVASSPSIVKLSLLRKKPWPPPKGPERWDTPPLVGWAFPAEKGFLVILDFQLDPRLDRAERIIEAQLHEMDQQLEALRQANLAKSNFLSISTHELKTPMAVVLGYLDVIRSRHWGDLNEPVRERLERVIRNAKRLQSIIEDVLVYHRFDSGRAQLDFTPLDVGDSLQEALGDMEEILRAANIKLIPRISKNLQLVGDPIRLNHLWINLLANAIRHTPMGGSLVVSAKEQDADSHEIMFMDTGVGISEGELEKVFEPFYQPPKNSESERDDTILGPGTGLGLTICRQIVHAHQGTITLENRPASTSLASGLTVRLVLSRHPISDGTRPKPQPTPISPSSSPEISSPLSTSLRGPSNAHILVVDDDPDILELTDLAIGQRCQLHLARSGAEAIQTILERPSLQAVLLDLSLPDLDGAHILRVIRAMDATSELPVIIFSAMGKDRMEKLGHLRVQGYLAKPFCEEDLWAVLRPHLNQEG